MNGGPLSRWRDGRVSYLSANCNRSKGVRKRNQKVFGNVAEDKEDLIQKFKEIDDWKALATFELKTKCKGSN